MKKTLVAGILGLVTAVSVMAQGRIQLSNYVGSYPLVTYGAGSGGAVGSGIAPSDGFTVSIYYSLTGGLSFSDASGIDSPTGNGWTLASGGAASGATATFLSTGIYYQNNDFSVPGWVEGVNGPISVVVIAYNGADYASSTIRGHSAAFDLSPTVGAGFAVQTGTSQQPFQVFSTTVVPEPSTFALAGLGLAGLLIFRRRK